MKQRKIWLFFFLNSIVQRTPFMQHIRPFLTIRRLDDEGVSLRPSLSTRYLLFCAGFVARFLDALLWPRNDPKNPALKSCSQILPKPTTIQGTLWGGFCKIWLQDFFQITPPPQRHIITPQIVQSLIATNNDGQQFLEGRKQRR